jgi:hypothetical protein
MVNRSTLIPNADMVIARFASYPVAGNAANEPTTLAAYQAVADYLGMSCK